MQTCPVQSQVHPGNTGCCGHPSPPDLAVLGDAVTMRCALPACWEGCHPTNPGGYKLFQVEMDKNHMAGKSVGKGMLQPAQLLQGECLSRALESHPTYPTTLLNEF